MVKVTPAIAGFLKGLLLAVVFAVASFVENAANLDGVVNPTLALLIASLASALESHLKAYSEGERGLFGAVRVQK